MLDGLHAALPPVSVRIVVLCLVWYLVLSVTLQLTKLILVQFTYPLFLSQFQFLIGAVLALAFISTVKTFPAVSGHFPAGSVPVDPQSSTFQKAVFLKILPLGLFQFCGKFFSLSATLLVPLATVSSIKALSPLVIVTGYRLVYRVQFPLLTYLSLTPLVGGVILMIVGESADPGLALLGAEDGVFDSSHVKGLIYCILSTVVFASQNIYGKLLITWDTANAVLNPAALVLNTDPSRPATPVVADPEDGFSAMELTLPVRRRNSASRLPYSTSDLRLDAKNEQMNRLNAPYMASAEKSQSINSPFAALAPSQKVAKPDKLTIVLYCLMIGFAFSFGGFVVHELPNIIHSLANPREFRGSVDSLSDVLFVVVLIVFNSLSHFAQTLLAFHLLGSIPALSYSIASMMKRIVLIAVSLVMANVLSGSGWFASISTLQFYGLVLIAIGLYCYDRWGSKSLRANRN